MRILLNDNELQFSGSNLTDLLAEKGFSASERIAIAVNETVIAKTEWSSCILKDGDSVLIITPAQGG